MKQPLMTLIARFDVNQVNDGINWLFSDTETIDCLNRTPEDLQWNRDINFTAGQEFKIAVSASDKDETGLESLEIIDCCLVTRPGILSCGKNVRTRYAPPSLFVDAEDKKLGALYQIAPSAFSVHSTGLQPGKGRNITFLWNSHLKVGRYNGSWELMFYITIQIKRFGEDNTQLRVFYFDPELEVGNGIDPPV